jgi:hypothetical protein
MELLRGFEMTRCATSEINRVMVLTAQRVCVKSPPNSPYASRDPAGKAVLAKVVLDGSVKGVHANSDQLAAKAISRRKARLQVRLSPSRSMPLVGAILLPLHPDPPFRRGKSAVLCGVCHQLMEHRTSNWLKRGSRRFLRRKQRATPAVPRIFDGEKEAELIALACSKPPKGCGRWTLRLLENKVLELVSSRAQAIQRSTVRSKKPSQTPSPAVLGHPAKGQRCVCSCHGGRAGRLYTWHKRRQKISPNEMETMAASVDPRESAKGKCHRWQRLCA